MQYLVVPSLLTRRHQKLSQSIIHHPTPTPTLIHPTPKTRGILLRVHTTSPPGFAPKHLEASVQHLDARVTPNPLTLTAVLMLINSLDDVGLRQGHHQGRQ